MARRTRNQASAENDEPLARIPAPTVSIPAPAIPVTPSMTDERRERELEDLLTELGTDGRIKVWHVIDGKSSYAGEMSLDGFTLDALTDSYGGGDKTLVFYQGRQKIDTLRVSLDPSIPPRNPRAPKGNAAAPQNGSSLGDMTSLIAAMAQNSMSSMQMMQTMMMQSQQMTTTMLNAVATAMTATKNDRDPMDVAVKIAELMKVNTATPASELFSVFERGMNVAAKMNGGDEDGTLALAREGLGVVARIIDNNKAPLAPAVPRTPARPPQIPASATSVPADTHATATPQPEHENVTTDRPWVAAARPAAALLLLSIGNVRPDTAANMIADRLTEEQFGDLLDDIESGSPDAFVQRFAQYFQLQSLDDNATRWMLECVQAIKNLVEPESDLPSES